MSAPSTCVRVCLSRSLIWRTPSGKRVQIDSTRMVSMTQRHLAVFTFDVTMLTGNAPIVISSQLINRQDGEDEYHVPSAALGEGVDPRKASHFESRVLLPRMNYANDDRMLLGYMCAQSRMTVAVAADHVIECDEPVEVITRSSEDLAKAVFRIEAVEGKPVRLTKFVAYHSSKGVPVAELSDRCDRTLDRVQRQGLARQREDQRAWYDEFWKAADIQIPGQPEIQQAVRYNLFSLAQASARADQHGVPAKGVTGSGYEGHYFWDTEVYVVPFLTYTLPDVARNTLNFRTQMLDAARSRARGNGAEGRPVPVAHDQWRGSFGLLRRRHGPGAHRCRRGLGADEVRRRNRRR